ncbi:MAG: ATP-binding cassette domain-containing protein, partial [Planctomycetota bacterium]|nr:ATP-binding cassette domain-containing protein [Planctomycetota bacterium]
GARGADAGTPAAAQRLAALDGHRADGEVSRTLRGLGFETEDSRGRRCREFSGGWQMRIALARLLLGAYDARLARGDSLLLLDEPTNHLDARARAWLREYLRSCADTTMLIVSHDEALLGAVCTSVTEVVRGGLQTYAGSTYAEFKGKREERELQRGRLVASRREEMARLEGFVTRFGAKATKASQARSRRRRLEALREAAEEEEDYGEEAAGAAEPVIRLPRAPAGAHEALRIEGGEVGHAGGRPLLEGVDLAVRRGDRVLLVGPNGSGKSTLVDVIGGRRSLWRGARTVGEGVRIGYFTQDLAQSLPMDVTALNHLYFEASAADPSITQERARATLGALGIRGDAALRRIGDLSGGEKAKVSLAAFVLKPVSLLLLDEPSNHIDVT